MIHSTRLMRGPRLAHALAAHLVHMLEDLQLVSSHGGRCLNGKQCHRKQPRRGRLPRPYRPDDASLNRVKTK